jgi:adenylosuccinate synthase
VLSGFDKIKVCTAYETKNGITNEFPYDLEDVVAPVLQEFPSWTKDLTEVKEKSALPAELNSYIQYLEEELGVPIVIVSVGPNREQTISLA